VLQNPVEIKLTVLLTVVSGKESVSRCLKKLCPQIDFSNSEIIVPFDKWSVTVGELSAEFPEVNFHFIEDLGLAESANVSSHQHRLYDRRRAIGLQLARGRIVAMTEDHAIPADDWCEQILLLHEQPYDVIGGAIENAVDKPLNWAWYYCDFGRYGKPFQNGFSEYISDINVAYKREALESIREIWWEAYHETTVHWSLLENGSKLFRDERMVVFQNRPRLSLFGAFNERIAWGRVFAETRGERMSIFRRVTFAFGAIFLPLILLIRVVKNMRRQKRTIRQMASSIPLAVLLLIGWSLGESIGYLAGEPHSKMIAAGVSDQVNLTSEHQS
jgi:hypothetical protein